MKLSVIIEFKDLHLTKNLGVAKNALMGLSGIYCISCTVTGAVYIGSAINLADRIIDHMLNHGSNLLLQRAINKYGLDNFAFQILEFCDKPELLTREQHYLDLLFSLPQGLRYNIAPTAGSPLGVQRSEETRQKISEATTGENNPMYGKNHSPESCARMSDSHLGLVPGNAKPVVLLDLDGKIVAEFQSQVAAAQWLKVSERTVRNYILSNKVFQAKYRIVVKGRT